MAKLQLSKFVEKRLRKFRSLLRKEKLDAVLVTSELNVTYLTGFTGDSSYLLVTPDWALLISDSRYDVQISEECPGLEADIRTAKSTMLDSVQRILKSKGIRSCGFEAASLTKAKFDELDSKIDVEWVGTEGWVEGLRAIKDAFEIATIRKSINVNERAFQAVVSRITPDFTERQIAHELEHQMRAFGASHAAFDPIVGVGERGALPHAKLTDRKVCEADFVLIDWGAKVDGYASDLTRVIVTSTKIPAKFRKIYQIVLKAQLAAIQSIRPGATFQEVDNAARSVIEKAGFGKQFGHGLGHGFGLQIHENPFLSPIKVGTLEQNMVVTVEPGIYIPGWGGIRIEDDVLVTKEGCEVLSKLNKRLDDCLITIC